MFSKSKKQLAILVDPDKYWVDEISLLLNLFKEYKPDFIFVGGSTNGQSIDSFIEYLQNAKLGIPIVSFPGNASQFSSKADALLYLSLLSGRNADYLIGQHVLSASQIKASKVNVFSTGYLLIESGSITSVEYISNTKPIPRNKKDIAVATAIAGELLGNQLIYLEAGSGAQLCVPNEMIAAVKAAINVPLIVGGGIKNTAQLENAFNEGADIVVIGNVLEESPDLLKDFISITRKY